MASLKLSFLIVALCMTVLVASLPLEQDMQAEGTFIRPLRLLRKLFRPFGNGNGPFGLPGLPIIAAGGGGGGKKKAPFGLPFLG